MRPRWSRLGSPCSRSRWSRLGSPRLRRPTARTWRWPPRPRAQRPTPRIAFPPGGAARRAGDVIGKVLGRQRGALRRARAAHHRLLARWRPGSAASRRAAPSPCRSRPRRAASATGARRGDAARFSDRIHPGRTAQDGQPAAGDRRADRARAGRRSHRRARARRRPRRFRPALRLAGARPHRRPLRQPAGLRAGEGSRRFRGMDIAAPTGTAILAPAAGIVTFAKPGLYLTGGTVLLDHGHGVSSNFLHPSRIDVKARRPRRLRARPSARSARPVARPAHTCTGA